MMQLTIHRSASRRQIAASLVAALAVGLAGAPTVEAVPDRGDVKIVFDKVQPANRAAVAALRRSGAPAQVARAINARYALPRDLRIFIGDDAPQQLLDNGPAYYAPIGPSPFRAASSPNCAARSPSS